MAHTPGPWNYFDEIDGHEGTPDLDPAPYEAAQVHPGDDDDQPICWLSPHHPEATEANARLIAAAPDLLAAAKDSAEHRGCGDPDCCAAAIAQSQAMDRLRAAIAKAEGQ